MAISGAKKDFDELVRFGVKTKKERLTEIAPSGRHVLASPKAGRPLKLRVLTDTDFSDDLEDELKKAVVEVAPVSNAYQISSDQADLSTMIKDTLPYYDYYLVELGLNVALGREAKILALTFEVDLQSNGRDRTDVTAFDVMPRDEIKRVKVIEGKISLGVSKLLNLIPGPIGKVLPNLLSIDINPWEFSWTYDKYLIDTSGPKNYKITWHLYDTEIVQGFNPTMILKARRSVSKITAAVQAIYRIKTGLLSPKEIRTDEKPVSILPI